MTKRSDAADESADQLLARGDYAGAAARAAAEGDLPRAIRLYERVWRFADAVPLAVALGDRALAVRLALDARDVMGAQAIAGTIDDAEGAALAAVAAAFAARGHHHVAAGLLARAGAYGEAAELYQRAGALLDAAGMFERAGRWQEAGRLYERVAAGGDRDPDRSAAAVAQLALGRLLGSLGRPLEATRALQAAARHPESRVAAQRRLTVEMLALGLPHAAEEIARRIHRAVPSLPADAVAIATAERQAAGTTGGTGTRTGTGAGTADGAGVLAPPPVPRRFRVLQALGAGALGRVYAAADELIGRTVALKVFSVGPGAQGPERDAFARFVREATAVGRLRHPHIVTLHELDENAGVMVLEHLPGGTLADLLQRGGPVPPAGARRLALEVLSGLAVAHRAGIVHRDVKPANIFFDAAGNAKLGDFGAAHLLDFGHTQTGSFIGTLAYLSPEQITGTGIGFPADLYSLAATLFEALTGRPPFLGPDVVGQHLAEAPPAPSSLRPGLGPVHDEVLLRALAKAPADRYAAAEAMAEAIERWPTSAPAAVIVRADGAAAAPPSGSGARTPTPTLVDPVIPVAEEIGQTGRGRLLAVPDPRVGRQVLVEEMDEPLDADSMATVRHLAALGGPHVQRILAVSTDGKTITYEALDAPTVTLGQLGAAARAPLDELWPVLAPLGIAPSADQPVAQTPGGPVILLVSAGVASAPASGPR